ncbi:MAG: VRR-NUC domain-containing protein [Deltaproteobacteria bacterium]|jgi:hypothetical protein|nr:VRR-NUC domain-containing protein [Deltaproteobacteria bacterium]
MTPRKPRKPLGKAGLLTEHMEQKLFVQWLDAKYPDVPYCAVPNGGKRSPITGRRLKEEGVRKGTADVFIAEPRDGFHGLFIEFKTLGGKLKPEQKAFLAKVAANGYGAQVCVGQLEGIRAFEKYIGASE